MNRVREIFAERQKQRAADARIAALRKPWYSDLRPVLAQLLWLGLMILSVTQERSDRSRLIVAACVFACLGLTDLVLAIRKRDRMWRELIRDEAPSLHERLSPTKG